MSRRLFAFYPPRVGVAWPMRIIPESTRPPHGRSDLLPELGSNKDRDRQSWELEAQAASDHVGTKPRELEALMHAESCWRMGVVGESNSEYSGANSLERFRINMNSSNLLFTISTTQRDQKLSLSAPFGLPPSLAPPLTSLLVA
jgi:hypothetical protein